MFGFVKLIVGLVGAALGVVFGLFGAMLGVLFGLIVPLSPFLLFILVIWLLVRPTNSGALARRGSAGTQR